MATRRLQVISNCVSNPQYSTVAGKVAVNLLKRNVLVDEKVDISVKGLSKHQRVTLHSFFKDSGKVFAACGHYIANEDGEVNSFQHASHGGTFEGVEPMGLFWSMKSSPFEKARRIMVEDVTIPMTVKIAVHDGFLGFDKIPWSEDFSCLGESTLLRSYTAPGVKRIPVREKGLYGTLFLPPGEGPFPAVIDIFGLTGGISEIRSPLLASHGIAGFSLGYVHFEDLPKSEKELDFNYFLKAFDWLAAHPAIDRDALGGISTCVGGGYLGVIALKRPLLKCIVTINNTYDPIGLTQVIEGETIHGSSFKFNRITQTPAGMIFKTMYDENDTVVYRNSIWRHGQKVLHIHGTDDQCVHPAAVRTFRATIPDEFKDNFTYIEYPGAGHLIEPPYMPLCLSSFNKIFGLNLLWGGEPKPHADAQENCWKKTLEFFHTHLQKGGNSSDSQM